MKNFLMLIFLISFIGCSNNKECVGYAPTKSDIERQELVNEITTKVAAKLKHEKGLLPFGFGGQTSSGVQMLALSFQYRQPTSIEQGRELLVASVQEFIQSVNAEKKIHPHLNNYPFESKNIQIDIFLNNSKGKNFLSGLHLLSAMDGKLQYMIHNPDGPLFKTLLEETYEEALEKLNAQQEESLEEPAVAVLEIGDHLDRNVSYPCKSILAL